MKTQNELDCESARYDEIQEDWDGYERVPRKPKFTFPRFSLPRSTSGPFLNKRQTNLNEPF